MSDQCPSIDSLREKELMPTAIKDTLNALGVQSCITKSNSSASSWAADGGMETDVLGGLLGSGKVRMRAAGSKSGSSSESIGCETIVALAKKNIQNVNNIMCTIKKTQNENIVNAKSYNNIKIEGKKWKVGGSVELIQRSDIKIATDVNINSNDIEEVASKTETNLKDSIDILKKDEYGFGATGQGSKTLVDLENKINQNDYKKSLREKINQAVQFTESNNNINITKDDYTIAGDFRINQSTAFDIKAMTGVEEINKDFFAPVKNVAAESKFKGDFQTKGEGYKPPPDAGSNWGDLFPEKKTTGFIILGIVALILIGLILYFLLSGSKKKNTESEWVDDTD